MNPESSDQPTLDPAAPKDRGGAIVAKLKGEYHQPDSQLVLNMLQELHYLVGTWQKEIVQLDEQIDRVRQSGPIVAGWMEAADRDGEPMPKEIDYQLCILDETGQVAARDCPEPEMFGISKALARHRQLKELIDRKTALEANLKHTLANLVHLRMDIIQVS
jgi:hypothetical protein